MKRKTLTLAISVFALLAIISVGFASWVITRQDQNKDAKGSITVETINGEVNYLESVTISENAIHFGTPATMNKEGAWLTASSDAKQQNLTATLTIVLTKNLEAGEKINLTVKADDSDPTKKAAYEAAIATDPTSTNYIKAPVFKMGGTGVTELTSANFLQNASGKYEAVVTIAFDWGTAFGGNNPYEYYNEKAFTPENVSAANTALSALAKLYGIKYIVTVAFPGNAK